MKKGVKKLTSTLLALSLICSGLNSVSYADAAKKPTLKLDKKQSVNVGKTKKIKLKTSGIKKIVSVKWKTSKKAFVTITKSTKKNATVKGLKEGKSVISATVKYKVKAKSKTLSKKLKCTVTVKELVPAPTATAVPTVAPTAVPTATPTPKPTRTPGPQNLLAALGDYVKNVGSAVAYSSWNNTLENADVKAYIKENLNSLTAENENKPEAILGHQPNKIRTTQAEREGIYIPANYKENYVPQLNYTNIDTLMKYAADNGIRVRYHGLLWHEQTSNWFFRENYDSNGAFVTPEVMDARLEYYIKNVMKHVYNSQYGDVVYCWDVVNEFYHMTECIWRINDGKKDKTEAVKCFYNVYGKEIFVDPDHPETSKVVDNPRYVKLAFKWAYEVLQEFNLVDKVELVYNDYDTNFEDVRTSILAVTSYINAKDDLNPNGDKYCTTIGMQTHDNLEKFFIKDHRASFEAFTAAGLNLQVTEMDVARRTFSVDDQIQYWVDFVNLVIEFAKKGTNFTGFTCWGLTDASSWIGQEDGPLLCGSSVKDKKPVYFKIIEAAYSTTID